jgi:glycosyltransferase involved in cell wall biosynthesis
MKILMISTDREILSIGTFARARMEKYAAVLGELHIIVLGRQKEVEAPQSGNLWVYTTHSLSPIFYGLDAIFRALRIGRPEVITVQDPFETGLLGALLALIFWRPLHVQVHTDFLSPAFRAHSTLNYLRVMVAGTTLRAAARVRVVAERIKRGIEAQYHLKTAITVLPIFVDTTKFEAIQHQRHERFGKTLLVVSRLESEKQVDYAIYALQAVRKAGVDAGLIIVGEGSLRNDLKELVEKLELSEYVDFVGRVDPLPYYAQADIVLVPSQYEGYGMVIIEALAAHIPVVATDVGVAREAGAFIAPADREGYVATVAGLFGERTLPEGALQGHPYENEEEYIGLWTEDVLKTATGRRAL